MARPGWAKEIRGGGAGGHGRPIVQGGSTKSSRPDQHRLTMLPGVSRVPKAREPSVRKKTKQSGASFKSNKCHETVKYSWLKYAHGLR